MATDLNLRPVHRSWRPVTYQIAYGCSEYITGLYVNKAGETMLDGNVEIFASDNDHWVGLGSQDILNTDVIIRHAYDAEDDGTPKMLISILNWDSDGWPTY